MNPIQRRSICLAVGAWIFWGQSLSAADVKPTDTEKAGELTFWDTGITGTWSAIATAGVGIRTQGQNHQYLGRNFTSTGVPKYGQGADSGDDGNLNYNKGDVFTSPIKLFARTALKKDDYSVVVSGRAWTDPTLEFKDVWQGSVANGYQPFTPLSDDTYGTYSRFSNVALWEGYFQYKPEKKNETDFTGRIGRQVLEFSNRKFFGVLDRINPLDQNSLVRPGALPTEEIFIPVNMLYGHWKHDNGWEFEAFMQLENRTSEIVGCGQFPSSVNFADSESCSYIPSSLFFPLNSVQLPSSYSSWLTGRFSMATGNYSPFFPDVVPDGFGQGGASLSYTVSPDLKVGGYFLNQASHTARLMGDLWDGTAFYSCVQILQGGGQCPDQYLDPALTAAGAPDSQSSLSKSLQTFNPWYEYPDNIRTYALQAEYKPSKGTKLTAEISFNDNYPIQIATTDFFAAFAGGRGPLVPRLVGLQPGDTISGYDLHQRLNMTVGGLQLLPAMLGAKGGYLMAELGYSGVPDLPPLSEVRYNRPYDYGFSTEGYGGACPAKADPWLGNPAGCVNDGFVTKNAWGYRLRGSLTYVLGEEVTLTPTVSLLHDVSGYSADRSLVQGRMIGIFSLDWTFKQFFGGVSYIALNNPTYWTEGDRDNLLVFAGIKFGAAQQAR